MEIVSMPLFAFFAAFLAVLVAKMSRGGSALLLFPVLLLFAPGSYASLLTSSKIVSTCLHLWSAREQTHRHQAEGKIFLVATVAGIIGAAIGTYVLQFRTNVNFFESLLGFTVIAMGLYLLLGKRIGEFCARPRDPGFLFLVLTFFFSLFINVFDGLFGGLSIFLTIYLVLVLRLSFLCAYAFTALSEGIVHLTQAGYLLTTESIDLPLTLSVLAGALLAMFFAEKLQPLENFKWLQPISAVGVVVVGLAVLL